MVVSVIIRSARFTA